MPQRYEYDIRTPAEAEEDYEVYEEEMYDEPEVEDSGYTSEELCDDYEEELWPQPIVPRPHITSLMNIYAHPTQKPEPISEEVVAEYEEYKKRSSELNAVHSANCVAVKKISSDIAAMEEKNKAAFKWSNQRGAGETQKKQLETDLAAAEEKKAASKAVIENHKTSGRSLVQFISHHARIMEMWEEMDAEKREIARMMQQANEAIERDMATWRMTQAAK